MPEEEVLPVESLIELPVVSVEDVPFVSVLVSLADCDFPFVFAIELFLPACTPALTPAFTPKVADEFVESDCV